MLNTEFNAITGDRADYYPQALRAEIDAVNERVYHNVNNGVYRAGFAKSQAAYEEAYDGLFSTLDWLEERLAKQRYLVGNQITEADWRLFPTLVRFDVAYFSIFKCNKKRIADYPNLRKLHARALPGARRRRHGDAALLRHQLLFDPEGEPDDDHSQGNAGRSRAAARSRAAGGLDDPTLLPSRDGGDLVAGNALSHLVRDRGACRRRDGEAGHRAEGGGEENLGQGRQSPFDVARIDEIERETKHDVIAFLTHLAEIVGPEARFVHSGMTSSDVLDTCFNVQLVRAADILVADVDRLLAALKKRAFEHKKTPTIGRSHGIHAEPTTFGVKLAVAYAEFARAKRRLIAARKEVATCAISGAVGTFAQIDPRVEAHVAKAMGLAVEPVSTQIIPRDRHAMFFATLGVVASSMERLAIEIRHLQRTEVLEAEEFFSEGQKGSSAMPHKRNPVLTENITGLARMVRSYALPAMENVALWHERDISHSSVERMIGPDSTVTLDFALNRLAGVIEKLVVYPGNMQKNLDRLGGLVHSQRVLIALTKAGMSREDAYKLVQKHAMQVWQGKGDFLTLLKGDKAVRAKLKPAEIEKNFDLGHHFKHVDTIFKRVFGKS